MRKTIFIIVITLLIGNQYSNLFGQDVTTQQERVKKYPIDFAIGNFSVEIPFLNIFINEYYPLATIGTACCYRDQKRSPIYPTLKVGGYNNKYNTSALFVSTEIGYGYTLGFGLSADANLGMGYPHLFRPNATYNLDSNREYEQVREWGAPSLMTNYSLSIGYCSENQLQIPVSVFVRFTHEDALALKEPFDNRYKIIEYLGDPLTGLQNQLDSKGFGGWYVEQINQFLEGIQS